MKMQKLVLNIFCAVFVILVLNAKGQNIPVSYPFDSTKTYVIVLIDGAEFVGNFLQKDTTTFIIKTSLIPKIEIPVNKIKSIDEVMPFNIKKGTYWFTNPNPGRYLFGPSAYNLKAGEGYYQNTYLFLNSFNVGLTDNISFGGGLEFISTFTSIANGNLNPIFYITPKVGFKVAENVNVGAGVLYLSAPYSSTKRTSMGVTYGVGTLGSTNDNITFGMGWGFVDGTFSNKPFLTVSGMTRVAKKTALVTENWFVPSNDGTYYTLISYGIRFFGEKISVDLAFLNNKDIATVFFIGIPYVDFVVKF